MMGRLRTWWFSKPSGHASAGHRVVYRRFIGGGEVARCLTCQRDWGDFDGPRPGSDPEYANKLWRQWEAEDAWERDARLYDDG